MHSTMRWYSTGILVTVLAGTAQAQGVLSDNDRFASYCLGYLVDSYRDVKPLLDEDMECVDHPGTPTSCADLRKKAIETDTRLQAEIARLNRYLLARGVLMGRTDVPGLAGFVAAHNQGRSDYHSCKEQALKSVKDGTNLPDCATRARCFDLSRIPMQ